MALNYLFQIQRRSKNAIKPPTHRYTNPSLNLQRSGSRHNLQWPLTCNQSNCGQTTALNPLRWEIPESPLWSLWACGTFVWSHCIAVNRQRKTEIPWYEAHSQCTTYYSTWHHYRRRCPGPHCCGRGLTGNGAGPACNPSWSSSSPPAAGSTPPETHGDRRAHTLSVHHTVAQFSFIFSDMFRVLELHLNAFHPNSTWVQFTQSAKKK